MTTYVSFAGIREIINFAKVVKVKLFQFKYICHSRHYQFYNNDNESGLFWHQRANHIYVKAVKATIFVALIYTYLKVF
jgi:hypothetical protein